MIGRKDIENPLGDLPSAIDNPQGRDALLLPPRCAVEQLTFTHGGDGRPIACHCPPSG